jgi:hypothetical protein
MPDYNFLPAVIEARADGGAASAQKALDAVAAAYHAASAPPVPESAPETPAAAASKLAALRADPIWSSRLLKGSGPEVAEFHALSALISKGDEIDVVMSGDPGRTLSNTTQFGVPSPATVAKEIGPLREIGLSDPVIRELISGHTATAGEIAATRRYKAESWLRKFEQGDKWSFCLTAGTLWPANQERP